MPKIKTPTDVPPGLLNLQLCDSFSVSSAVPSVSSSTKNGDAESLSSESEAVEQVDGTKAVSYTVQGLYTRWYPTPEQEASNDPEYACCRRRIYTRPLFEEESNDASESSNDDDDEEGKEDDGVGTNESNKDDTQSESESDDASESGNDDNSNGEEKKKEYEGVGSNESKKDDTQSESGSENESEDEYETAMFVPKKGLVGGYFWHEYDDDAKVIREDRAVLFQSQENYERLISHERFKTCFEGWDYMEEPSFGEQVIVNGIDVSDLAIGDVFEIEGGHSPLEVEITAPRKPCSYMNFVHGTLNGKEGIQNFTHQNILAGWFARVLVAGELREGMKFIRKAHPNPKWTLTYIHKALYGEGNHLETIMNVSSWNRDREELEELIALPQLGEYEWKVEGRRRLLKFDDIDWKCVKRDRLDPQAKAPKFFLRFYLLAMIFETLAAALRQFGIV